ncbi:hypothetical protein EMCRGX_G015096 [Ephydatia muelleri]
MADFCACLKEEIPDLSDSVVQEILKHRIDRVTFIELTEDNLKEIAPLLGDRMKLKIEQKRLLSKRIDQDIEFITKKCDGCRLVKHDSKLTPVHPWEFPEGLWKRVHIDFAGLFEGKQFLVAVDAYSKWPEVVIMEDTSTDRTLDELRVMFASLSEQITVNTASQVHTTLPQMGWQSTLSKPKAGFASIKEGKEIPLTSRIQFLNTVRERSTLNTGYHASSDDDKKGPTMSTTLAQA